jgi:hypothetical protein
MDISNIRTRTDAASNDLLLWTNVGDGLTGDLYAMTVSTLATLIGSIGPVNASPLVGIGYATGAGGAVTQITSAATGVTLSKPCGQITTVALTTAAAAEEAFIVTNTLVDANDVIAVSTTYAGAGTPAVTVKTVGAGVFTIVITNLHASAALDAVLVVNFVLIKSVAA